MEIIFASIFDPSTNLQLVAAGLALGAIYAVVALGFVLVHKATDVLNLAHGEFVMMATYLSVTFFVTKEMNIFVGALIVVFIMLATGIVIHYGIMRRMVGQTFFSIILATLGLATFIKALILIFYRAFERGRLESLPQGSFYLGDAKIRWVSVVILIVVAIAVLLFYLFFKHTRLGLHVRASADSLEAAAAQGIDPDRVYAISWAAAMVMAGVGGILFGHFTASIDLNVAHIGLKSFPAAAIGGFESLGGAILGGLIVGVVEMLAGGHFGTKWRDPVSYSILFAVLLFKPAGLFGRRQLERV